MADKLYYSIKEISEMFNLPFATLRFWEKEVVQLQPRTHAGRTRLYSPEDIEVIRRIIYLRQQNVPVKELSKRLQMDDKFIDKKMAARENLLLIRQQLVALRDLI